MNSNVSEPDIIERLREAWLPFKTGDQHSAQLNVLMNEAANDLERLRGVVGRGLVVSRMIEQHLGGDPVTASGVLLACKQFQQAAEAEGIA